MTPKEKADDLLSKRPKGNVRIYVQNMINSHEMSPGNRGFWEEVMKHIDN